MDILSGLFGAADEDDEQTRVAKASDFVKRVETGDKADGYSPEEAFQNYASVSQRLSGEEFESAAADALGQLSPEERREFAHVMKEQGGVDIDDTTEDPNQLAGLVSQLRAGSGGNAAGMPAGMFGGGGNNDIMGALSGLLGGGNLGGGVDDANQAGIMGLLNNPIVKMVLGLIAANGMKRVMGGGNEPAAASGNGGGGGFLDSLLGGGDDNTQSERDRQDATGGGGLLDSLFGGGDDDEPKETPRTDRRESNDDPPKIKHEGRKRSL